MGECLSGGGCSWMSIVDHDAASIDPGCGAALACR